MVAGVVQLGAVDNGRPLGLRVISSGVDLDPLFAGET